MSVGQQLNSTSGQWEQSYGYQNGGVRTEAYNRDGELGNLSGTAAHPLKRIVDLETSGPDINRVCVKEIKLSASGGENEWTKTYLDLAGRPYKIVHSAAQTPYPTETIAYNAKGQIVQETDADGVSILYQYNTRGELEYRAVDLDRDGVIDLDGTDRVTRVQRTCVADMLWNCPVEKWTFSAWDTPNVSG